MDDKSLIADKLGDLEELLLPRRKTLLTWWLKIFGYLFLFLGAIAIMLYPLMFILQIDYKIALYGLESQDRHSFLMLAIVLLFALKGIASYGLLFEQNWAIEVAMVDAAAGILVCLFVALYTMLTAGFSTGSFIFSFRLELILLLIYMIKLFRMQAIWKKSPAGVN